MPTKAKLKGGATTPRQFRLTAADLKFLDDIAAAVEKATGLPTTRTAIVRGGIVLRAAKWLK
jgi:hypothetical protein